ncbi:transcriptional regulator, ArsR family [Beutenbergia cavernae DSM 12333]|uniref:Transcriptional regulator, ArsR family n=1 Tax=Beutenbergia cavernae (strain ATCC BAA-8 / DSM 12333 / CCUG 43141 / JCM 11478 / NBRC 16432 / NCIMB 13614 / HKI 0122) TaxID=471853 RepID=C5BWF0_BEUC1|nr:metalloregulator ArsR/SmtB family transcription factor [Beutenbergia cavernae]ACQ78608.1 transcriptional regulator, ArsR family [Beutenbergia cavernae DSM 12333]
MDVDVLAALDDPVRREILRLLRDGDLAAGSIAARFPVSRPAISRHLRVLREAGLVRARPEGRRQVYRLDPAPLAELERWLAELRSGPWPARLDALETEVYRTRRERRTTQPDTEEHTA